MTRKFESFDPRITREVYEPVRSLYEPGRDGQRGDAGYGNGGEVRADDLGAAWDEGVKAADVPIAKERHEPVAGNEARTGDKPAYDWRSGTTKARALAAKTFPQMRHVVPGLLPEGVTILAARPKIGKTWLAQQIACAVAGEYAGTLGVTVAQGDAIMLNLEDGDRRAQGRMTKYFGEAPERWPERLTFARTWRRLDEGGVDDLREWCRTVEMPKLVSVDTLKKVRPPRKRTQTDYDADYEASQGLKALCEEYLGLAVLVLTHDRKAGADDPFDTVNATLGLTGGVDAVMMLKRVPHGMMLHVEGRDLEETVEKLVEFDRETCRWRIGDDVTDDNHPDADVRIIAALARAGGPMSIAEIEGIVGGRIEQRLRRMCRKGTITRVERGRYAL